MNKRVLTIFVVVGLALAALPLLKLPAFYESFLYLVFHWVVLATSWNILSGYSGYFSFGHGAFFGLGMYTTAVLAGKFNWPFLYTLPMAALVPALFGVGLGAVVFRLRRLRGELFGLLTLAVTFVIATIILNTPIDGGPGVYLSAVPIPDPQVKRKRIRLQGDVPSPIRPPPGCHFHTRCPIAQKGLCDVQSPVLKQAGEGHWVACHLRG